MESLSDFEKSYELSTQIDDWHNILIVLGNLIRVYQQLAQYTKALEYAQKSLKLEGKMGSLEDIAQTHLTVGVLYESLGVFDLAKQHIDMARDRFIAVQNRLMLGWCNLTNAYLYKDMDNFSAAFAELDKLDKLVGEIKDEDLKVWSKLTQADLYMEKKEFDKVKKLLDELTKDPGGEFSLRKKLLEIKLESLGGDVIYHEKFDALADECEKNFALELQWEVYASLGEIYEVKNQPGKNLIAYARANEVIESIAKGLSEAYRDSYKQQRSRKKVIEKVSPKPVDRKSMRIERAGVEGEESVYEERTADLSKEFKKK
jgi:tetratricopeptide (TPR) repeat protein